MKNVKIALLIMAFVILIGATLTNVVKAQASGSVSTTVTIGSVSVSISPGAVEYGNMLAATTKNSFDILSSNIEATVGAVVTDLDISGADTIPTGPGIKWDLSPTAGLIDDYVHAFKVDATETNVKPTGTYAAIGTSTTTLADSVAPLGSVLFSLELTTPTTVTSLNETQTAVVTVTATFGG